MWTWAEGIARARSWKAGAVLVTCEPLSGPRGVQRWATGSSSLDASEILLPRAVFGPDPAKFPVMTKRNRKEIRQRLAAAERLARSEEQLQRVQDAIQQGIRDREAYLRARRDVAEAQAQVYSLFLGEPQHRDPL